MDMSSAIPDWLTPVAWIYIAFSLVSVAFIATDIYGGRRRHDRVANELVWITSALYLGPLAIPVYLSRGRTHASSTAGDGTAGQRDDTALAVLPGGSASAVAHLIAVPLVVAVGWTIAGMEMWPMIILIAVLATAMLVVYGRIAGGSGGGHTRGLSLGAALVGALITVAAFDIGMVGWMLLLHVNSAMPPVTESTFWFLMQIGVLLGLLTGYPAVRWLLRRTQSVVPA